MWVLAWVRAGVQCDFVNTIRTELQSPKWEVYLLPRIGRWDTNKGVEERGAILGDRVDSSQGPLCLCSTLYCFIIKQDIPVG